METPQETKQLPATEFDAQASAPTSTVTDGNNNLVNKKMDIFTRTASTANTAHLFQCNWKTITDILLVDTIQQRSQDLLIIDVRHSNKDYPGGHIIGAVNIAQPVFLMSLAHIFATYHQKKIIVLHCMYSQSRGPRCAQWYSRALEEIVHKYTADLPQRQVQLQSQMQMQMEQHNNTNTNTSSMTQQTMEVDTMVEEQQQTQTQQNNMESSSSLYCYSSKFANLNKLHVQQTPEQQQQQQSNNDTVVNQRMIDNLKCQQVFLLKGGFSNWFNKYFQTEYETVFMQDVNENDWMLVSASDVNKPPLWRHKRDH